MTAQIQDDEKVLLLSWLNAEQNGAQIIDRPALAQILASLQTHTGIGFDGYKEMTLSRRVQRRTREQAYV